MKTKANAIPGGSREPLARARLNEQSVMDGDRPKEYRLGSLAAPDTMRDMNFYERKRAAEAKAGRELTLEEFRSIAITPEDGTASGTSIFDPVLCEIAYRWFSPPGGLVLDPFAGGSVRGIVAAKLGRRYVGVDLREEQVAANREQAEQILGAEPAPIAEPAPTDVKILNPDEITPVEQRGDFFLKRDDLFELGAATGCKARTMTKLLSGATGVVGFGSRKSTMISRVAQVAEHVGLPCRVHTATGEMLSEMQDAVAAGAELIQHTPGYLTVLRARAEADAQALGWALIPWGMECPEAIEEGRKQTANVPEDCKRLVIPVGSGMAISGVLWGLKDRGLLGRFPILGVRIHADPFARIDKWAPPGWRDFVEIVEAGVPFEQEVAADVGGVVLDPIYEAKCRRFMQTGDLLWIVGIRGSSRAKAREDEDEPPPPFEVRLEDGGPEWARGRSLADLRSIAALFKEHDKGLALGAFSAVKENAIATADEAGQLRAFAGESGEPIAAILYGSSRQKIRDFSDREIAQAEPEDAYVKRMAGDPQALAAILSSEPAAVCWLEIWKERAEDVEIAEAAGFRWVGSKIKASSEIVGVYVRGPARVEPTPPAEAVALRRLTQPVLDVAPLVDKLDGLEWADHYSTYNKGHTWSALALRGYGGEAGFIEKPAEMSKKWKAEHPEALALEIADTPLRAALPEAEALIAAIPGEKHRIRLMRLAPNDGELTRHADITDPDAGVAPGKLLRIHIPLVTNPDVRFEQWLLSGERVAATMAAGEAWYLDTRKPHTAVNRGATERIHLVMDVESSPALLDLLDLPKAEEVVETKAEPLSVDALVPRWIVGDSRDIDSLCAGVDADLVFSCPPYADLERYSDDPRDLSTMDYRDFRTAYFEIVRKACARLRPDSFACFVVGEVRDRRGAYIDFVGDTVQAFRDAGLAFYNEAILLTAVGSLPIRVGKQFSASRKLGKTHQNVLVFCKGDGKRAARRCGPVEVDEALLEGQATEEV